MEGTPGRVQKLAGRLWGEAKGPLYRNAFFIMLSSVIGIGLGFFFWVVFYRVYRPADAGYGLTLLQTVTFLSGFAHLGLGVGIIRFLPETDDRNALVNSCLSISGLLGGILALAFVLGAGLWTPELAFIQRPVYVVLIVLTGMAYSFAPILDSTVVALRRADVATWRSVLFGLVKIPLPLVFVVWFTGPLGGRMGAYLSIAVAFGISVLATGFLFLPRVLDGYFPRPRLSRRRVRPMFGFSVGNWVAGLIGSGSTLLLPLLIVRVLPAGAERAAYFYAAFTIAGLLWIIPGATMTSFLAEASQANARRARDERKAVLLSLALLVPGIAGMWFAAEIILELFNSGTGVSAIVEAGITPLRILSFASIPVFLNGLFGTRVRIRKQVLPLIAAAIVATGVTLGAGYVLLGTMDITGLAYAYVIGQAAEMPILWWAGRAPMEAEPVDLQAVPP